VQARVRAGESAEDISDDTGWPLDKVMRYAEPLLQERAYIAEQAQSVEVRRSGSSTTLVESALKALGAGGQGLAWDAFRREDSRWIVVATFGSGEKARQAQWTYDPAGRNLHPLDDQARALMGVAHEALTPAAVEVISDALDLAREEQEQEPARPRLVAVPDPQTVILQRPEPEPDDEPVPVPAAHSAAADEPDAEPAPVLDSSTPVQRPAPAPAPATAPAPAPAPPKATPAAKPRGRKGRASMPSWDEILFGTTRTED
jgi:hypothetical protein